MFYYHMQSTKLRIGELLAVEEEKRKTQQDLLSSFGEEETDDSVDTTQGNYHYDHIIIVYLFINIDT